MSIYPVRRFLLAVAITICIPLVYLCAAGAPSASHLPDFTDLVDKVGPAVINIRTATHAQQQGLTSPPLGLDDGDMSEFFRRFFGIPLPQQPGKPDSPRGGGTGGTVDPSDSEQSSGVGSGFILSADGYVMTNAHVVHDADAIYVTLTDKREFKAKLIGVDERTDVALVKINAKNLPTVMISDSNMVRVGEWVVAIGSPFGLENTVTAGIVSAKGRDTGDYLPFIQTDVAVNPGNSGGPLINMKGEVIGINSQIYSRTGGYMGISFAIPIDEAIRVADQLKVNGRVVRGRIAVAISEVTKEVSDSLGLAKARGALVSSIEINGPADKAGVQPGDIILKFNGRNVSTATDLPRMIGETKPGIQVTLTIWRKGKIKDLFVVVAEMQPDITMQVKTDRRSPEKEREFNQLGLAISDLSPEQLKSMHLKGGVQIDDVYGPGTRTGLQRGDIILRIGDIDVLNTKQFELLVQKLKPQKSIALLVRRGDNTQFIPVRPRAEPAQK
ncbi:DegQ family serine endoprotease [Candidatus Vallotia tarda]|uniref:Probable periplasmic serine endoprotease DegP-like n=1 Tax=Candidatus Vallotiella hemipterorum TaxID=1177213 RepID=A0A916JSC3_9BURK|nr:DegQ family serine endoprotease [Candidatus Vallotia tarda]CAG7598609.1 Probable periplasmic serine endoprotease DegP-like [Candidatus Vallotia tarda]